MPPYLQGFGRNMAKNFRHQSRRSFWMRGNVTSQRPCLLKHSERVVSKPTLNDQINIDQVTFCQNAKKTRLSFKNVQIQFSFKTPSYSEIMNFVSLFNSEADFNSKATFRKLLEAFKIYPTFVNSGLRLAFYRKCYLQSAACSTACYK